MKYQQYINNLNTALQQEDGPTIARLLACYGKTATGLTANVDGFDVSALVLAVHADSRRATL